MEKHRNEQVFGFQLKLPGVNMSVCASFKTSANSLTAIKLSVYRKLLS